MTNIIHNLDMCVAAEIDLVRLLRAKNFRETKSSVVQARHILSMRKVGIVLGVEKPAWS